MRRSVLPLCIVLCSFLANSCSNGISRATAATVLSIKGRIVFGPGERDNLVPVTINSRIHQRGIVRSSEGASLGLQLLPCALAGLPGDSELIVAALNVVEDGNETAAALLTRSARIQST